jgi:mono/diheme cytochrome c family protein
LAQRCQIETKKRPANERAFQIRVHEPVAVALLKIGAGSQAIAAGDQARGQTLFSSRCGACHALDDWPVG